MELPQVTNEQHDELAELAVRESELHEAHAVHLRVIGIEFKKIQEAKTHWWAALGILPDATTQHRYNTKTRKLERLEKE